MKLNKKTIAGNVTTKGSVLIAFILPWLVAAIWFTLMWSVLSAKEKSFGLNWYTPLICVPPLAIFALWGKLFISTVKDFTSKPQSMITEENDGICIRLLRRGDSRFVPYSDIEGAEFTKEKNRSGDTPNGTLKITLKTKELIEVGVVLNVEEAAKYINGML